MSAQVIQEWLKLLKRWQTEQRKCTQCGEWYKEADNIGRWLCRQHIESLDTGSSASIGSFGAATYTCCGLPRRGQGTDRFRRPVGGDGCVAADHNARVDPYTPLEDICIPRGTLVDDTIQAPRSSLIWSAQGGEPPNHLYSLTPADHARMDVVRRYDWHAANKQLAASREDYIHMHTTPSVPGIAPPNGWRFL